MKTYKNVSTVEQLGIAPGETGEADIPKEQEDRMVARGAIEVVGDGAKNDTAPEKTPEEVEAEEKAAAEKAEAEEKAAKEKADAESGAGRTRR